MKHFTTWGTQYGYDKKGKLRAFRVKQSVTVNDEAIAQLWEDWRNRESGKTHRAPRRKAA